MRVHVLLMKWSGGRQVVVAYATLFFDVSDGGHVLLGVRQREQSGRCHVTHMACVVLLGCGVGHVVLIFFVFKLISILSF
jgi:hypothetical protein